MKHLLLFISFLTPTLFLFGQDIPPEKLELGKVEQARIKKVVSDYCESLAEFGKGADEAIVTLFDLFVSPSQLVYDEVGFFKREENVEISRYLTHIKRKYPKQITFRCYTDADKLKFYVSKLDDKKIAIVPVNKSVRGAGFNFNRDVYMLIDPKKGKIINIMKELLEGAELIEEKEDSSPAPSLDDEGETTSALPNMDGVPYDLVFVKGAKFRMGNEYGQADEKPVHPVSVRDFYMGMYEVTQQLWQETMGTNPSRFKGCKQCPVESITWQDAMDFIKKFNEKTGLKFRLPTEAEWEFAAKGGIKTKNLRYAGADELNTVGWYKDNSAFKTKPIGGKSPNELGIFDMSGNVSEWVEDWFERYTLDEKENPTGPLEGQAKVFRGGCYGNTDSQCTASDRAYAPPTTKGSMVGLRLAMDVVK